MWCWCVGVEGFEVAHCCGPALEVYTSSCFSDGDGGGEKKNRVFARHTIEFRLGLAI